MQNRLWLALNAAEPGHSLAHNSQARYDIVALARAGVDFNHLNGENTTPLAWAVGRNNLPLVKLLCEMPGLVISTTTGGSQETIMHQAVTDHNIEMVKTLGKLPILYVNKQDYYGNSPLHKAARSGDEALVRVLLDIPGIQLKIEDKLGNTPVDIARDKGHPEIVELLRNAEIS